MKRIKSIDELYAETCEFDLVVTNDASLATALNARIDHPMIGSFTMTPKEIAASVSGRILGRSTMSDLQIISAISESTGLNFKFVHSEIENIREIRQYTKDVPKHLHTNASREVYNEFDSLPTIERVMDFYNPDEDEFFSGLKVAVIGVDFFNDLDKHFIPAVHEEISIFTKDEFEIDNVYEVGNDRQIAENAADLIVPEKVNDYAIVLNTTGPIADAMRAALYRRNLPFKNKMAVRDLSQIRDYLQFVTYALQFDTIRVKHVKELFSNYNGFFKKGKEEFLLCRQTEEDMMNRAFDLWTVMKGIRDMTFMEVRDGICDSRAKIQVGNVLNDLGVSDKKVTRLLLNDIKYAVDNVNDLKHNEQIPENEKKGVLLVDCNNSVYIDRPVVIFLGMEQDWNKPVVGKSYIDVEEETEHNVDKLKALIQQGSERLYLVNSTKNGQKARPSMLFDLIMKRPVKTFECLCQNIQKGRWHSDPESSTPEAQYFSTEYDFNKYFSKSGFNQYYSCPRQFLFGKSLKIPDEKTNEFGKLIHTFAEYYVCYPDDVRSKGIGYYAELISDKYSGLSSPLMEHIDNDKIRKAMYAITKYIDSLEIRDVPLDIDIASKKYPNEIMMSEGKTKTSSYCEQFRDCPRYYVTGPMDLLYNGIITDYKLGSPHSIKEVAKGMSFDKNVRYPEFQPAIYLAIARELNGSQGEFNLFYAMDNDVSSSEADYDIRRSVRKVKLLDKSIKDIIVSERDVLKTLQDNLSQKFKEHVPEILSVIEDMASDDADNWSQDYALITNVLDAAQLKDNKTNRGYAESAVKKITKLTSFGMVITDYSLLIPETTLDEIMNGISDMHKQMLVQSKTEFPPTPRVKCKDCAFYSVCTREVIELGGDYDE